MDGAIENWSQDNQRPQLTEVLSAGQKVAVSQCVYICGSTNEVGETDET